MSLDTSRKQFERHLRVYYKNGYIKNTPISCIHKLERAFTPTVDMYTKLNSSIIYPECNGIFVIMLDNATTDQLRRYVKTTKVPYELRHCAEEYSNKINTLKSKIFVDINNYKLPHIKVKTATARLSDKSPMLSLKKEQLK